MDNSDTAEYRAFQSCFDRLVTGVAHDVESVARKTFTKNLISSDNLSNATNQHHSQTHRATKLLERILIAIKQTPASFDTFVTILEEIPSQKELAKELTSERAKQTGFNLCRPGKPTASDVTEDTITIEWEKPEHVSERVKFYFVRYRSSENQEWKYLMMDSNNIKLTITDLSPQTKYIFKVRPELEDGETGAWSEDSDSIETKPPPCQPGRPTASAVTRDSITVEWSKPEHQRETVHSYCLSYCCSLDRKWIRVMTQSNENKFIVSNLSPQTKYIFKVRPELVDGETGAWSEDSDPIKTEANPPGRPVATKVTHDSISLKWDPPQFNCENIDCYKISYCKCLSQNSSDQWTYKTNKTASTTISSLLYNTEYVFQVQPVRKNGELGCESPCSETINTRPASPPGRPAATNVTHNSITLNWSKPRYGAENGTNYVVLQCNTHPLSTEEWKELKTSSMSTNVEIKELYPSSDYLFKVKLVCQTGESDKSEVSDPVRTKSVCKPGKPYATKITQNSITLQWKIPEQNSESVKEYTIKYNNKTDPETELMCSVKPQNLFKPDSTISSLSSGTGYKFTVVPSGDDIHCEYLESEVSDVIVTTVTPPPGRPQLEDVTHDTAMVKWTHPHQGREKILYYTVQYHPAAVPCSDWKERNTSGLQTYKVVSELSIKTKYAFKVIPKCKDGMEGTESEASDSIVTMATSPPGVPVATEVTHEQISLKWTPPEIGGDNISSYAVYYRQLEVKQWKFITTTDNTTHITIRRLKTNEHYLFKVKANCKPGCGDGAESKSSEPVLTKCCLTGRPRATAVSHNSVQLVWDKPRYEYDNITSYEVHYKVGRESDTWHETRTVGRQESITINGLKHNTEHIFKVRPICEGTDVQTLFCTSDYIKTEDKPPVKCQRKPSAIAITEESIMLEWEKPEDDSENVKFYFVTYYSVRNHKWNYIMTDGNDTKLTITNLSPQTKYIFKVRPELEDSRTAAWSEVSDPIETKTYLSRFDKLTASTVTHDSVELKLVKVEHGTEDTECYTVCYQIVNDWKQQTMDNVQDQEHITINELQRNTKYIFKVFAKDGTNIGPKSDVSDPVKTKATSPPSKPVASAVTHKSITVKWIKPEHGHEDIKSYSVIYFPKNQPEKKKIVKVSNTVAIIDSLMPLESYVICVQPICETGVGTESEPSDPIKTKATSPPGKPVATKVTHDSISLRWEPPEYCHEDIEYYGISYCSLTAQQLDEKWEYKKSSSSKCTIPALIYNTIYLFKVCPVCKNGEGCESPLSDPIKTKAASSPGKPTATDVTHNSIKLTWSKPNHGYKSGTNYAILQTKGIPAGTEEWKEMKTSSMSTIVEIKGLDPSIEYLFKVKLVGPTGESEESEVSDPIRTKSVCKPGKPYATKVTHNSITLTWDTPKEFSTSVETYTITPVIDPVWAFTIKAQPQSYKTESTVISNLNPGSQYRFNVIPSGHNTHHPYLESEPSDLIVTKVTSQPENLEIRDATNDTVTVKWTHPNYGKERVLHYTVYYRSITDPSRDWKEQNTSDRQTHQVITGLSMRTKYIFYVVPKCKDEMEGTESEASIPVETAVTSPPGVPVATEVTYNTISLKWAPPDIGEENVSSYSVYYRQLEHKQWESKSIKDSKTYFTIAGLYEGKLYQFKVKAVCKTGCGKGAESKACDFISTRKPCTVDTLRATAVTHNSIELVWDRPCSDYEHIVCYEVQYRVIDAVSISWCTARTKKCKEAITVTGLQHNTVYLFRVRPICDDSQILISFSNDSVFRTKDKPFAEILSKWWGEK